MKKNIFLKIFIIVLISSCRTIEISDLKPVNKNSVLIPNLEPQIDLYSFQSAYSLGSSNSTGFSGGSINGTSNGIVSSGYFLGQSTFKTDKRIQDVLTVYERDVKDNICQYNGEKKGYIICKIPFVKRKAKNWGLMIFPNTLGIYSFLGIPLYYHQTETEIEVEIQDLNKKSIARYTGYGVAKVPVAMYYGYYAPIKNETGNEGGVRKSNILAVKMALNEIKQKIQNDNINLIDKLK